MKELLFLIVILFILYGCNANKSSTEINSTTNNEIGVLISRYDKRDDILSTTIISNTDDLIGTWHEGPSIGASYGERYHFYDNGEYLFEYGQDGGIERIVSESGLWSFDNNKLLLSTLTKKLNKVGKLLKSHLT
ncbi:MAG: hypothetical protein LBR74_07805 [Eubacterium sp.]|jgi:hypothetical protein|nr:hypothetical protein [Eubacterium sp.]